MTALFLAINVAIHEHTRGSIKIPKEAFLPGPVRDALGDKELALEEAIAIAVPHFLGAKKKD